MLPAWAFACVASLLKPGFTNKSAMHSTGQLFSIFFARGTCIYFKTLCPLGKKVYLRLDMVFND